MSVKRLRVTISGKVQGVFFRASTRETALRLRLKGWVKNLPDGRVDALFEGEEADLEKVLEWCSHGPAAARPEKVESKWGPPTGEFGDFFVSYW